MARDGPSASLTGEADRNAAGLTSGRRALALAAGSILAAVSYLPVTRRRLAVAYRNTLSLLMSIMEGRDPFLRGHSERVAAYAVALGKGLLKPPELPRLHQAALLHDTGKLLTPEYLLLKPGSLTPSERNTSKEHAEKGAELVSRFIDDQRILFAIRHHHERYEGHGYPGGMKGQDIPLWARIVAVANAFDAMVSRRPHRAALTVSQAIEELHKEAGKQFDPVVVARAAQILPESHARLADQTSAISEESHGPAPQSESEARLVHSSLADLISNTEWVFWWREGRLERISPEAPEPALEASLRQLCGSSPITAEPQRGYLVTPSEHVYYVHVFATDTQLRIVHAWEVTPLLQAETACVLGVHQAYSRAFSAVTRGKLQLLREAEVKVMSAGRALARIDLAKPEDVRLVREAVARCAHELGIAQDVSWRLTLAVSEAATNAIKHAKRGRVTLLENREALLAVVADSGPGIPLTSLPKAVLEKGFSSVGSLGYGFEVMLRSVDRVGLCTNDSGTTVILEVTIRPATRGMA